MLVLRIEPRPSGRAASALNHQATPPALGFISLIIAVLVQTQCFSFHFVKMIIVGMKLSTQKAHTLPIVNVSK